MSTVFICGLLLQREYLTSTSLISKIAPHFYRYYSQPKYTLNMNEAFVQHDRDKDVFDISFRYVDPNIKLDRQFNFSRHSSETINHFLRRIDANINRYLLKKVKRKRKQDSNIKDVLQEDNVENENIKVLKNDLKLDGNLSCKSMLEDVSDVKLVIFDREYVLKINAPSITGIALPSSILAGFPTYPSKFEALYTDKTKSTFNWYKRDVFNVKNPWIQVGEGYWYIPSQSDIGCKLKLTCLPRNDTQFGPLVEITSNGFVDAGPKHCPFETRHAFTKNKLSGKSFRVMSYNILADTYADSDYSKEVLFPHCPEYALDMDYRKQLILKEIIGFNADIMCFQEVDNKIYHHDLAPILSTLHYNSEYTTKSDLREGLAIFFNQERFNKLDAMRSIISQNTDLDEFNQVWVQIQNEKAKHRFQNRSTTIQAIILQSKENPKEILIVGNVHLYFHPNADHIRLLQAYYSITYLHSIAKETKQKNPECNVSIILCGDFNSVPECGIYQLITTNYVPENSADWCSESEEIIENISLKHDLNFSSACGTPEYTNYTPTFSGCLDYIFYQKDYLEVEQVIPMPSKEEIVAHDGLPSVVFPSDHISLCADLKWSK